MREFLGKTLILLGVFIIILGLGFLLFTKLRIPRIPGDILISKKGFTLYFPLGLCILLSLFLTLILNLIFRR